MYAITILLTTILLTVTVTVAQVFSEEVTYKVEINEDDGHCSVRKTTHTLKNGERIASEHHREALAPELNNPALSRQPNWVRGICQSAWTPEIRAKYAERLQKSLQRPR